MKTSKEVTKEFLTEFAELLKKYGATLDIESDERDYSQYSKAIVTIYTKWEKDKQVSDYTEIDLMDYTKYGNDDKRIIKRKLYISKAGEFFDAGTEAFPTYEIEEGMYNCVFRGLKDGEWDEELCPLEEFYVVEET